MVAIGLGGVFLHLEAKMNFYRLFNEAIENFPVGQRLAFGCRLSTFGMVTTSH